MMNNAEINKALNNLSKLDKVRNLDDNIKDAFDIIELCRPNIANQEIREKEKRSLLFVEKMIKERKEILSDPYFSDIREAFAKYEEICLAMIILYRGEIALYE